jgi:ribonuclease P protein component
MRLTRGKDFLAARHGGVRVTVGPLQVSMRPNDLGIARLGLSISRRVGKAVTRNGLKRRVREAFRMMQHEWREFARVPADPSKTQGYDVIVGAKAHEPLTLAEYRQALAKALRDGHHLWQRKHQRRTR